ncbi:MAG: helix-turn-helix domain-containing protein, partial [Solirubrobacterales bacterium]|nr:helix-turn-helix domain-containing protein [Solirubrobacterales bacterium]
MPARVEGGLVPDAGGAAGGVSERTAGEWVRRYRAEGELGLVDRSSAPEHVSGRTDEARVELSDAQAAADDR